MIAIMLISSLAFGLSMII
ncbi:hypothetical protein ACM1TL_09135 [Lysinibacillus capsici]|nr:hypothetical protein [Lysinibacillus capsici]MCT1537713.1 hypothetical protein [Lysinibacillus capsici]MCT1649006.1 hypothetical protein [Lysinibacillus capsici]UKJ47684.1 hypothetical protein L6W14_13785 [Lysinibacillus sp. ACHW1.5]WGF41024.1 hypothetical protein QBO96_05740 [Lysinibacillus capsici]